MNCGGIFEGLSNLRGNLRCLDWENGAKGATRNLENSGRTVFKSILKFNGIYVIFKFYDVKLHDFAFK
jgi:hypothetical protein